MSEVKTVKLTSIDDNPWRNLKHYPYDTEKLAMLQRSMKDVGCWEGVIVRAAGGRYQQAFGHHRTEAARREFGEDARIPVIVRDLTDEQMLQFLGRENSEDFNADFLTMLAAWSAAEKFFGDQGLEKSEPVEIARLLGWVEGIGDGTRMNQTAKTCTHASKLVAGGYMNRTDLKGLAVTAVRELCGRIVAQHEMLEKMATKTGRPAADVERAKKTSGSAGKRVAQKIREGKVARQDIRGQVDVETYRYARDARKQTPLFSMFVKALVEQIERMLKSDNAAERLDAMRKALSHLTDPDDIHSVKKVRLALDGLETRAGKYVKAFSDPHLKVVKFKEIAR
jgi:hypothetical protein